MDSVLSYGNHLCWDLDTSTSELPIRHTGKGSDEVWSEEKRFSL